MRQADTKSKNPAWQQYECGKQYKRRLGLYETVKRNERFYRGDQWQSGEGVGLPHPIFNIIYRVINFLVCSVASAGISITFSDEQQAYVSDPALRRAIGDSLQALNENTAYRWSKSGMDRKVLRLLSDAALSGDGAFYCYWDRSQGSSQGFEGDIVTETIDNVNIFPANVNVADIQSQDYIILSGRASVRGLRQEARDAGVKEDEIELILPDGECDVGSSDLSKYELEGEEEAKTTYIIKFWREDGRVLFEKSTRDCIIRRGNTGCTLYPIAYLNWASAKNSFHGVSPISSLIPNQQYINRAYAMIMKHMTDTAFSKIVYDKSKIPEWSNEVGEAIAAYGGGSIADSVSVVGVGDMQSGYMELIDSAVELTKELMGATESALGNLEANNTSAILALQETSRIPLVQVRSAYYQCIVDLANIWVDMMCAYYPSQRLLPCCAEDGTACRRVDFSLLKDHILCAKVEVSEVSRFSAARTQSILDKLFDGGHISAGEYVRRLPVGCVPERNDLLEKLENGDMPLKASNQKTTTSEVSNE